MVYVFSLIYQTSGLNNTLCLNDYPFRWTITPYTWTITPYAWTITKEGKQRKAHFFRRKKARCGSNRNGLLPCRNVKTLTNQWVSAVLGKKKSPRKFYQNLRGDMAGEAGFEPTHTAVKVLCLTAWRLPNMELSAEEAARWKKKNRKIKNDLAIKWGG